MVPRDTQALIPGVATMSSFVAMEGIRLGGELRLLMRRFKMGGLAWIIRWSNEVLRGEAVRRVRGM